LASRSWPDHGEVTLFSTLEIPPTKPPLSVYSSMSADPAKPDGHAVVLPQVGSVVRGPEVTLSVRPPGMVPTAATANPAVTRPAPAIMPIVPRSKVVRRIVAAVRHRAAAPEIV
jgi:hypothetical protein